MQQRRREAKKTSACVLLLIAARGIPVSTKSGTSWHPPNETARFLVLYQSEANADVTASGAWTRQNVSRLHQDERLGALP